ncbi:MAG TPA: nuclear transport factor 2 family protein [Trichormus sp.]
MDAKLQVDNQMSYSLPKFVLTLCLGLTIAVALPSTPAAAEGASGQIEVELVGASASSKEAGDVLDALQQLLQGLGQRNLDQIGGCLGDDVTMFDDHSHHVVFGKQAVLDHVKSNVIGTDAVSPVKHISVYYPFVDVKGDTAMVSFRAVKEMADSHHTKLESWCSEVFELKNGKWLVLQLRTGWKPMQSNK